MTFKINFAGLLAILVLSISVAGAAPVLVSTEWLAGRLGDEKLVIVDMSSDPMQYQRFHLPGAVYLSYRSLIRHRKKDGIPVSLDQDSFVGLLGRLGITRDYYVVIYDDMGGLNTGRFFRQLESIGHPAVSVVDGGLVQWILEGRKVTNVPTTPGRQTYVASGDGRDNEVSMDDVNRAVEKDTALVLDVRSQEEYVGDEQKRRGGHVPGARWWEWTRSVDLQRGFRWRDADALNNELAGVGADKAKPVIVYCRSGHRASQAYLTLRSLGYENVQVYSNSMNEYGRYQAARLKRGMTP